jgi:hypothetical protein
MLFILGWPPERLMQSGQSTVVGTHNVSLRPCGPKRRWANRLFERPTGEHARPGRKARAPHSMQVDRSANESRFHTGPRHRVYRR